ncbi:MAG: TIGR01777 family protein [Proteobacteria bacterium]|nr:TIGR01777 family protein [Pseudomonadota bacterium]NIS72586.1 TIGR01777 family protein [Pseudomonadota bacterium]
MNILITGGTGFVGSRLSPRLVEKGHQVSILTRRISNKRDSRSEVQYVEGDPTLPGPWQKAVADYDVLVNLAGASLFGRWTPELKRLIRESRILTTRYLVEAIPPNSGKVFFSTSAVGYYGFHEDEELDEFSPPGNDFLAMIGRDWESEAMRAQEKGIRVIITRFGIVLGRGGGALQQMITPFRWFVGGPLGSGHQWLSWVHIDDLVEALIYLLGSPDPTGPFNLTSPHPVQNRDFAKTLGKILRRPSWMPAPALMIRLALGEFGSVILKGQRVIPRRLVESGFSFRYPELEQALRSLLT